MLSPRIWYDPPHVRWGPVLATAAVVFAPLLGWMAHERGLWWSDGQPLALNATPTTATTNGAALQTIKASLQARASALPVERSGGGQSQPEPGETEVCGLGIVKAAQAGNDESDPLALARQRRSPTVRAEWEAALQASPDVRTRAAGLRIAGMAGAEEPGRAIDGRQADERKEACREDAACEKRAEEESAAVFARASAHPHADALARLARDSKDPVVYALAMHHCPRASGPAGPGACPLLSYEQWASIDPDNAAPWLYLADQVVAGGGDPSEALQRAARARHNHTHWAALHGLVMAAQPSAVPPLERLLMSVEVIGVQAAEVPPLNATVKYCSTAELRSGNRRQTCEALADLLVNRGDTLLDLGVGRAVGEKLGWSADRVAALRDEGLALMALQTEQLAGKQPYSCASAEILMAHFAQVTRLGELVAMRELLRRSGKSIEALAGQRRDAAPASLRAFKVAQQQVAQQQQPTAPSPPMRQ